MVNKLLKQINNNCNHKNNRENALISKINLIY